MSPLHAFLRSRRSIRRFRSDAIPRELLERVLETAIFAPSAHNRQPWRFAVVANPAALAQLVESMAADFRRDALSDGLSAAETEARLQRRSQRILGAPAAVVLCLDTTTLDAYPDTRRQQAEWTMATQSVALAGGALLLAAHSEGLGGVWVCAPLFAPEAARRALDLPATWLPQGLILLGYPGEQPPAPERKPISEVAVFR